MFQEQHKCQPIVLRKHACEVEVCSMSSRFLSIWHTLSGFRWRRSGNRKEICSWWSLIIPAKRPGYRKKWRENVTGWNTMEAWCLMNIRISLWWNIFAERLKMKCVKRKKGHLWKNSKITEIRAKWRWQWEETGMVSGIWLVFCCLTKCSGEDAGTEDAGAIIEDGVFDDFLENSEK